MSEQVLVKTFETSAVVAKNRFVSLASSGKVAQTAAGARVLGANCGQAAVNLGRLDVGILGIFEVEASGTISTGAKVASAANGKVAAFASNNIPAGIALSKSTADGDLVRVLIQH